MFTFIYFLNAVFGLFPQVYFPSDLNLRMSSVSSEDYGFDHVSGYFFHYSHSLKEFAFYDKYMAGQFIFSKGPHANLGIQLNNVILCSLPVLRCNSSIPFFRLSLFSMGTDKTFILLEMLTSCELNYKDTLVHF